MKHVLFSLMSLFVMSAQADVRILKSKLDGHAVILPNGDLQVFYPSLLIGNIGTPFSPTPESLEMACNLVNRKLEAYESGLLGSNQPYAVSIVNGSIAFVNSDEKAKSSPESLYRCVVRVAKSVTCR